MDIWQHAIKGRRCWWLAPSYLNAAQVWRELKAAIPAQMREVSEKERSLLLRGGGEIHVRSALTADRLRGAGLDFVVLDEAAFLPPALWSEVVQPMLLERRGRALLLSTPCGFNWFYDAYMRGVKHKRAWRAWHFTSYENGGHVTAAELDALRQSVPAHVFEQEYLAQFTQDGGTVFRAVRAAATAPPNAGPLAGHRYVAGLDWGREHDYTACAVLDADTRQMVALERFTEIGWQVQRDRLKRLAERWNPAVIWAEANSIGGPNVEALQAEGLPVRAFQMTVLSKPPLIEALALAVERGEIGLLADETLLMELSSYALERLPGGGYRYSAPRGMHDDTVIATALAWHGVRYGSGWVEMFA